MTKEEAETIIKEELEKTNNIQDRDSILKAQRITLKERRTYIEGLNDFTMSAIILKYPFLKKAEYVSCICKSSYI